MKRKRLLIYLTAALGFIWFGSPAPAAPITIQVITTFDYPGSIETYPHAINDRNEIVGDIATQDKNKGFFRSADGQFSPPILEPDDTRISTGAFGINNSGTVVGSFVSDDNHGFFLSRGVYTQYDVLGSSGTGLNGINNAGDFAGIYYTQQQELEGFVNVGGVVTTIDIPNGSSVYPHQLNSANQVVGSYFDNSAQHSFGFYTDTAGTLVYPISAPRSINTYLYGINDHSWIVGQYFDQASKGHGLFFIPPNLFVTFDYAGSSAVALTGINRKGFICGYYRDSTGVHGILAQAQRTIEN